jgi:hypothetical protein
MIIKKDFEKYQQRINEFLAEYVPSTVFSGALYEAMRYSV